MAGDGGQGEYLDRGWRANWPLKGMGRARPPATGCGGCPWSSYTLEPWLLLAQALGGSCVIHSTPFCTSGGVSFSGYSPPPSFLNNGSWRKVVVEAWLSEL